MFNFRVNSSEPFQDIHEFASNLVKKTRPYLTESQRSVIVQDLVTRVRASTDLIYNTEAPFQFGKNTTENARTRFSSTSTEKDSAVGDFSPRITPTMEVENRTQFTENRKRSHKTSNGCSSTPKIAQQPCPRKTFSTKEHLQKRASMNNRNHSAHNSFMSDIKSGAPAMKKKRPTNQSTVEINTSKLSAFEEIRDENNTTGKDESTVAEEQKKQKMPAVFERLYAARKPSKKSVICSRNVSHQKTFETTRRDSINKDNSLKQCIGSVQRALDNLKLLTN